MKTLLIGLCAVVLGAMLAVNDAEAKRLGGGRSVGTQRSVTNAPSSTPAKPAQQQAAPSGQQPAAQPASGLARWMPLLGGLALGGMLGWLLGSNAGSFLLLALLAIGAVLLFRAFARRRESGETRPVQFAGMGQESVRMPAAPVSSAPSVQAQNIPAGFDVGGFLRGAKLNFLKLQAANDAGSTAEIREFTTDEMFDELSQDLRGRAGAGQHTDVMSLDADLLEVTTEGDQHWASVRFSGTVREAPDAAPEGFEEVWNLVKPASGARGWLLAGIQQMH